MPELTPPLRELHQAPPAGSLEHWAYRYVLSTDLEEKLAPAPPPTLRAAPRSAIRLERPGRPTVLRISWAKFKAPKSAHALRAVDRRAQLLHTFWHHELQAAELLCWALLAFPDAPPAFGRGLIGICLDEIRHMGLYRTELRRLGHDVGAFPVRDWFWERAPAARTPLQFLALMGLGFEAGNLDHSQRFEQLLHAAGDASAARLLRVVGEEEVAHVAFAAHWFVRLGGPLEFERWRAALPPPLSPMLMRGRPICRERRRRAGIGEDFLEQLETWQPASPGG
jgi:uncharacterized ferritin-like protein (DUF455 family)